MFEENTAWKWRNIDCDTIEKPRQFRVTFGVYGNQSIEENTDEAEEETNNEEEEEVSKINELPTTNEQDTTTEEVPTRKSTRVSKKPRYLDDYIYLAEEEGKHLLLLLNEEPSDFCVGLLGNYMHDPKTSHGATLKQVLWYLKGTVSLSLTFKRADKLEFTGYSDSSLISMKMMVEAPRGTYSI